MLNELYEYALSHELTAAPGFKPKTPKAYVSLAADGTFLGIDPPPDRPVLCPDIGSGAQSATKCNILVEKALVVLSEEKPQKKAFYLAALAEGAEAEPKFDVLRTALTCPDEIEQINTALAEHKIKPADAIGFKVDGLPLESSKNYLPWWDTFRLRQMPAKKGGAEVRCLITGKLTQPIDTVPKVSGLRSVGGHSSGDSILCFDKDAFCSYGFKQGANAPVSEAAITGVNAALSDLIGKAPAIAGTKWLHWYAKPLPENVVDPFAAFFDADNADAKPAAGTQAPAEDAALVSPAEKAAAESSLSRLLRFVQTGKAEELPDCAYYLMPLTGASGRMMVRDWQQGTLKDLTEAVASWFSDLDLIAPYGGGYYRQPTLWKLNQRLLKMQKGASKSLSDRMKEELSGLEPRILSAAFTGGPLPDTVAARALRYIRSGMLGDPDAKKEPVPDPVSCQFLKLWLCRRKQANKGDVLMKPECNPDYPSAAYQCGRMMAVFAAIQTAAMGRDLGAGVVQRYYATACVTPAIVFGRLTRQCQYHLSKIESKGLSVYYENLLSEISGKIGPKPPVTLDLAAQAEFAMGYYQQRAALYTKRTDKTADQKEEE